MSVTVVKKIVGDDLTIPELGAFKGREVEIVIRDAAESDSDAARGPLDPEVLASLREDLADGYDFDAWKELRKRSKL